MFLEQDWQKRLLIGLAASLALAGATLLLLSARGTFVAAIRAPRIVATSLIAASLGALVIRRRSAVALRRSLAALTVALAIGAILLHNRVLATRREAVERPAKQALIGRPAPALEWSHSFNMPHVGVSQLPAAGQVTILDFWATWCSPCRVQMPKLEELHRRRREQGVHVVGVTTFYGRDSSPEGRRRELQEIGDFLRLNRVSYPIVVAGSHANHDSFRISALPTSVLVDRHGNVIDYGIGAEGSEAVAGHAMSAVEEK